MKTLLAHFNFVKWASIHVNFFGDLLVPKALVSLASFQSGAKNTARGESTNNALPAQLTGKMGFYILGIGKTGMNRIFYKYPKQGYNVMTHEIINLA